MSTIPLGPFELYEPIGHGGMGEVWRGIHRAQRVPVAVKVLTAKGMRRSFFLVAFRNEVRAMAGLDHPCIALVFDHGEVSEEAAALSEGRLAVDSPYIAMELAHGGTLAPWAGRLAWADCRDVLLRLLDALAHAHARGVIHRDLKPANVLLCTDEDLRPGIKLTDFGLAHLPELTGRTAARGPTAGTPHYMAPEQVQGRRREYGPWTDLYSLGRLALALVWGTPLPDPNRHVPATAIPPGFDAWVSRLLQQETEERFQRAADAAMALMDLGEVEDPTPFGRAASRLNLSGETFALTGVESASSRSGPGTGATTVVDPDERYPKALRTPSPRTPSLTDPSASGDHGALAGRPPEPTSWSEPCPRRQPPIPASWRSPNPPLPPMRLLGAGLGLYGLRSIALVDREQERDALWEALRAVRAEGRARAVALVGPAGCGKSRLAEWLTERAHEVGAGTPLRVTHAPLTGPADGVAPAITRLLRCVDLDRPRVRARLEDLLRRQGVRDPDEWIALTELLCPASEADLEPGVSAIQFASPTERQVLERRFLERLSADRPVILWLDDVQWGDDALAFASHLLVAQKASPSPILIVLAAREEALAERPAESALLDRVLSRPESRRLPVGPLSPDAHAELVRGLLGLEGALAAQVEARTAGNPLFAVQLVGDWVYRGLLEPGEDGFRLKPGARVDLPDLLHKVWVARVEAVLRGRPAAHGVALEVAAVLGQDVVGGEWRAACALEGVEAPVDIVEELLGLRLARTDSRPEEGWSFVHGMLRESLERRSRESGRWWAHHRACAAMLSAGERPDADAPRVRMARRVERLGRHLLAAGDLEEALDPLTESARERLAAGDYAQAAMLLTDRERAITALDLPPDDPRWGEGWVLRAMLARCRGEVADGRSWSLRAQEVARMHRWRDIEAQALLEEGRASFLLGDPGQALDLLRRAESVAVGVGDRRVSGMARCELANVLRRRADTDGAMAAFSQAERDLSAVGDAVGQAYCRLGMGEIALERAQTEEARRCYAQAVSVFERAGSRRGLADAHNTLGELERRQGDLEGAEEHYRVSRARYEAIGSAQAWIPDANLSLVLIARERYPEARRLLEGLLLTLEREGRPVYRGHLLAYLLPCVAAARDWSAFSHVLAQATAILDETHMTDADIARLAELAAELARDAGQRVHAREALGLAVDQWRRLGQAVDVGRVVGRLRGV